MDVIDMDVFIDSYFVQIFAPERYGRTDVA
jgi:hypothetical protein